MLEASAGDLVGTCLDACYVQREQTNTKGKHMNNIDWRALFPTTFIAKHAASFSKCAHVVSSAGTLCRLLFPFVFVSLHCAYFSI